MPLTSRHLATLRAALQFWKEETLPYGLEVMLPYFESTAAEPLTLEEIAALDRLLKSEVCYVICELSAFQINNTTLFTDFEVASSVARGLPVATLFLPQPTA